jgi:ubiquinone/menaquinone biosynthesis C-methylase UbiE
MRSILVRLIPHNTDDWAVLDLGSGTGDFIDLAHQLGAARIVGVDISKNVLSAAERRFRGVRNVELRQGTIVEGIKAAEQFDLITSVTVLQHHVTDAELYLALSKIRESLKSGGTFIALEISFQDGRKDHVMKDNDIPYLIERSGVSWRRLFEQAGFELQSSPTMPQLGIFALRKFASAITLFLGTEEIYAKALPESRPATANDVANLDTRRSKSSLKRKAYFVARCVVLGICYIFDHLLRMPLPLKKARGYEVFILRKSDH